jgi:N-glycosylase/DNA lyase
VSDESNQRVLDALCNLPNLQTISLFLEYPDRKLVELVARTHTFPMLRVESIIWLVNLYESQIKLMIDQDI